MGAPKLDDNLRNKQIIEALIKRLNERLLKNPADCKKAALILESWINKKKSN